MRFGRFILLLFLSFTAFSSFGQSPYVDSLENLLNKPIPDTVKVWALNELSREHIYGSREKSIRLVNEALELAKRINYTRGEAYANRVLASINSGHNYLAYTEFLQRATKLFIQLEDSVGLGNCYITEAVEYGRQLNYEQSINFYNKALPMFRKAKMQNRIAVCLNNIGYDYLELGQFEEAKKSFVEAISIVETMNKSTIIMNTYSNLGLVQYQLGDFEDAEKLFMRVLELNDEMKDNASPESFIEALIGQSLIYKRQGHLDKQHQFLLLARENAEKFNFMVHEKDALFYLSEYYLHARKYDQATKALQAYRVIDESIEQESMRSKATEIASVINSVKLETDFEHAQDDLYEQGQVIQQQENTLIGVALIGVLFFVLIILLLVINRNRKALNKAMTTHRIAIDQKNSELIRLNQTKDKFFSVVAHDLRSPLNSLLGFSTLLAKHADALTNEEIKKMGAQLQEAVENTLKMTENLIVWARTQMQEEQTKPELMEVRALVIETFKVFQEIAAKKEIKLDHEEVEKANVYVDKNHFSLILRNLISNAIKYTDVGGKICVKAKQQNGSTEIIIEDTGLGMDDEVMEKLFSLEATVSKVGTSGERGTGLGLVLCKDFIERNRGSVQVKSEKNKGSRFIITLPSSN